MYGISVKYPWVLTNKRLEIPWNAVGISLEIPGNLLKFESLIGHLFKIKPSSIKKFYQTIKKESPG